MANWAASISPFMGRSRPRQTTTVAGSQISAAARAGGNATTIDGVSLNLSDTSTLLASARAKAVADAKAKAVAYAHALGRPLGSVISMSETPPAQPFQPLPYAATPSAGRAGIRLGKVSELTVIAPLAPGGAARLRAVLQLRNGNFDDTDKVGTVHNMRFVFLDNDTKLLFATAYDGDWDPYIDDFATKIPDILDLQLGAMEGWPGVRSPAVKDYIAKYQVQADFWYVATPDLTVAETRRLERVGKALDTFLDTMDAISA